MRKWKYDMLEQFTGEVEANTLPEAVHKAIDKLYENMTNPETLDFQYIHLTVEEIKK